MTSTRLMLRSASYHWRTNLAVTLGVATAVSVLAGALLVGDSVRGSLRDLAIGRLGRTEHVVSSGGFFREAAADAIRGAAAGMTTTPLIVANGFVTLEKSGRTAAGVLVYGVDERFWRFHGQPAPEGVVMSPGLAAELETQPRDVLLVRLQKPSAIPIESLFGRKDDVGRTVRLDVGGVLQRAQLGEFALRPQQADVRAIFAPLNRIQRDLGVAGKANTILVAGATDAAVDSAVRASLNLEDLGVKVSTSTDPPAVVVEGAMGILSDPVEAAARKSAEKRGLATLPVFTYLANTIRHGDRQIPYSLVTATDLSIFPVAYVAGATRPPAHRQQGVQSPIRSAVSDRIVLNEWAAGELKASPGDRIELEYVQWDPTNGLTTHTTAFTADDSGCVLPISGFAADRRLAPEYPGITAMASLADWDPPFPVDLSRVRPQDEKYWKDYRTTPKAFISFERGRELWKSRYGGATSIRLRVPAGIDPAAFATLIEEDLRASLAPQSMGVTVSAARRLALEAASGATDFGEYFTYFSFFLVVSALLLALLFFRLGIEQRLRQIGILRASGFTLAHVRRLLLAEALVLASAGSAIGVAGALAYGQLIVYGLRTWWIGAVGTTLLELHVSWASLAIGAAAGIVAAALCVIASLRAVARMSPRALLTAQAIDATAIDPRRVRRARSLAAVCAVAGGAMLIGGFARRAAQGAMFFGAGGAMLVASMFFLSSWLRARDTRPLTGRGARPLWRLGFRSAAFRPSRSVLSAALIASAAFIIVSVDAFRHGGEAIDAGPRSGTGGFTLIGESELPIVQNPNDAAGRDALVIQPALSSRIRFTRFRVRAGDDASCLNLYRPTSPTIIAPEAGFIESGRFAFATSMARTDAERANPWTLLRKDLDDGAVPVIADATSLQYVLHASVGDTWPLERDSSRPTVLKFVGALSDSVLQGQLVMSEENFVRLFPAQQGYRFFLIDTPGVRARDDIARLAGTLEHDLAPFGFDAVLAGDRLASFHRVENTYLSTFQALGGLGLVLGTIGLAAILFRNVLERRRELALLRAVGYDAVSVSVMIVAEAALLLGAGLAAGAGCAALAVAPAWLGRGGTLPGPGLLALLVAVVVAGLLSSIIAARAALRGNMLEALRAE